MRSFESAIVFISLSIFIGAGLCLPIPNTAVYDPTEAPIDRIREAIVDGFEKQDKTNHEMREAIVDGFDKQDKTNHEIRERLRDALQDLADQRKEANKIARDANINQRDTLDKMPSTTIQWLQIVAVLIAASTPAG